jgi:flagellar biosynthesis/type III secretory pathway M-ring protein FliF/YscJ
MLGIIIGLVIAIFVAEFFLILVLVYKTSKIYRIKKAVRKANEKYLLMQKIKDNEWTDAHAEMIENSIQEEVDLRESIYRLRKRQEQLLTELNELEKTHNSAVNEQTQPSLLTLIFEKNFRGEIK